MKRLRLGASGAGKLCTRGSNRALPRGPSASRMRAIALFGAFVMLSLGSPVLAGSSGSALPNGKWELTVCLSSSYTGSRCAHLDEKLKLRVQYLVGPTDQGKILFEGSIPADVAQQLYGRALSVIRSFGDTARSTVMLDGPSAVLKLTLNGNAAQVSFSAEPDDAGPDMKDLVDLLRELTHAF